MKIVVVSDSHGLVKELEEIYIKYKNEAMYFIHCGDIELDDNHPVVQKYKCVNGNCDEHIFSNELMFHVLNRNILVIHGHYQSVKYKLNSLYYHALERGADIVLFGHTHHPIIHRKKDMILINPGSILANRGIRGRSYAIIDIKHNSIDIKHYDVVTHQLYKIK